MKSTKAKKGLSVAGTILTIALYIYSVYSAYFTFKRGNTGDIILYTVLLALCSGIIMLLYTLTDKKKSHSTANKILVPFITFIFNGMAYYSIGLAVQKAYEPEAGGSVAAGASCIMFGIALAIYMNGIANRGQKAQKIAFKIISAVCALSLICSGLYAGINPIKNLSLLKPIYSLLSVSSDIGGIATSDKEIVYDFAYATEKDVRNTALGTDETIDIKLAKNESEGFQIIFATASDNKEVSVSVSNFKNSSGNELKTEAFKEIYSEVLGQGNIYNCEYADALVPVEHTGKYGGAAELKKGLQQGFFIRTHADKDAKAGEYTAVVTAKNEKNEVILEREIKATVWNFTLPDTPANDTAFCNFKAEINYTLNGIDKNNEKAVEELDVKIYEMMLENRLSAYSLPYDILDERADKYMSDPRVKSFKIPYPEDDDELLVKYYTKVSSNPDWAKKGYFYPIDEPGDSGAYERYTAITERLNRLCPGYRMVTPFNTDKVNINGNDVSSVQLQAGKSSILCGLSDVAVKDNIHAEMMNEVKNGSQAWWYVCLSPQGNYCNFFEYQDALKHRLLMWQQKSLDFTGLLYWGVDYYEKANPWETALTWGKYAQSGDGMLIYPGGYIGLNEPVASIRFVNIADGMEDYDYFALAEAKYGKEWVNNEIAKVTTSPTEYTSDHVLFEQVRREIGETLNSK